jgi:hypothetical protein
LRTPKSATLVLGGALPATEGDAGETGGGAGKTGDAGMTREFDAAAGRLAS